MASSFDAQKKVLSKDEVVHSAIKERKKMCLSDDVIDSNAQ